MPDDDVRARQRTMPAVHAATVRLMGTDLLTVRVDLDGSIHGDGVGTGEIGKRLPGLGHHRRHVEELSHALDRPRPG